MSHMTAVARSPTSMMIALVGLMVLTGCAELNVSRSMWSAQGEISGRIDSAGTEVNDHHLGRVGATRTEEILIYVEFLGSRDFDADRQQNNRVVIRQGRQEPELHIVNPEQPLKIHNLDSIYHDLFTADDRNQFEIRLGANQESETIRLEHPGFVRVFCRLHPTENFAFLVARADRFVRIVPGSPFRIHSLPRGDYRIQAGTVDSQSESMTVRVEANETADVTLRLLPRKL